MTNREQTARDQAVQYALCERADETKGSTSMGNTASHHLREAIAHLDKAHEAMPAADLRSLITELRGATELVHSDVLKWDDLVQSGFITESGELRQ